MNARPEVWAGVECTVNRVGDIYFDQLQFNGHDKRLSDLDHFAALGLKTLRYPFLWERMAPVDLQDITWTWTDERVRRAEELGISLIAGLVHHGSGPRYTNLLDPLFPEKLASFAGRVAERYPHLQAFTPINEALTTARFSGLYGHWYPHSLDPKSFLRILLNECRATVLAMQSIRKTIPHAQLVQTEDMGRIFSTPFMSYEAEFENARRWLTFDILTGRLQPGHELWSYCARHAVTEEDVAIFLENPCPPDIVGINHYLTSNRFLDERQERYPACYHGGNEQHRYADIEAVLVGAENLVGPRQVLRDAWERYQLPVAITETHIGSSRDEQLRWLDEYWKVAIDLKGEGVDIRAVTIWALLGSYDWNCLVTQARGFYEPGAFDLRAGHPRPTALAGMVKALAKEQDYDHPVLDVPGWWHRPDRLRFAPVSLLDFESSVTNVMHTTLSRSQARELLITGSPGALAVAFTYICRRRGLPFRVLSRQDLDIADEKAVARILRELQPWALINAAGYTRIDEAETNISQCHHDNVLGPTILSKVCAELGIPFLTFSSHMVFDGKQSSPYTESSRTGPLNVYGKSKVAAEAGILSHYNEALIIRSGDFFGPWDGTNFLTSSLRHIVRGADACVPDELIVSPSYLPDLVDNSLDLLIDGEKGIWHLANEGSTSMIELAQLAAKRCHLDPGRIRGCSAAEAKFIAPRPAFGVLASERARLLPPLDTAVDRYAKECRMMVGRRFFDPGARPEMGGDEGDIAV